MTTATITPLSDGTAVVDLHGFPKPQPSLWAALAYARQHRAEVRVLRFPDLSPEFEPRVRVLADITSPAGPAPGGGR